MCPIARRSLTRSVSHHRASWVRPVRHTGASCRTPDEDPAGHDPLSQGGHRLACGYRRAVLRWLSALVVVAVLSGFAVLLLTGQYHEEGPVLVRLTETHGVHVGDLFVVLGWAVALLAVGGLLRSTGRRDG